LLTRSLDWKEKALGPEHPDLAATLTNLGVVYRAQARYADAEAALSRALAIQAGSIGPEHPNTAGTMLEYARVLRLMKRRQEADRMEARARAAKLHSAQESFTAYTVDAADLRR